MQTIERIALLSLAATFAMYGQSAIAIVPGTANPYLAGMPDGTICCGGDIAPAESPVQVTGLVLTTGEVLTFSVTGSVSNTGGVPTSPPDGDAMKLAPPNNGISSAYAPINSLVGVFLNPSQPSLAPPPPKINFGLQPGLNFGASSPGLREIFFIGDGLSPLGPAQQFVVPAGATRLYLAAWDQYLWTGNTGAFTVVVTPR